MIRALQDDDAEAYVSFRRKALLDSPLAFAASPTDDFVSSRKDVCERLHRAPEWVLLGAFQSDDLIGTVGLLRDQQAKSRHKAHLWGMYVAPGHRRKGIGSELLEAAIHHARSLPGVSSIYLGVTAAAPEARRLYQRAGFRVWGTEPEALSHDGTTVVEHHMALHLELLGEKTLSGQPEPLHVQRHGPPGRSVVVLHGGPGAPGGARALARALADPLHVLEPWQRWSSEVPLTVDQHVEDLAAVIAQHIPRERPALVGESWGAMLGLAFAARYPDRVSALVLIGCGTFDAQSRAQLHRTIEQRTSPELKTQLTRLAEQFSDEGERFAQAHRLSDAIYTYCRSARTDDPIERFDLKGHLESWNDMVRLQESGLYPAAFSVIKCPVLMLHGTYDPHPGPMIRDGLKPFIPHLEYREFERCGHSPWAEEHARDRFLAEVRGWLERS